MECAICYDKIFKPTTDKEYDEVKKIMMNLNTENMQKFKMQIITNKNNPTYKCNTPKCKFIICGNCFIKLTHNGKDLEHITDNDLPTWNSTIICSYCRQVNWKYYMKNNVLDQLQRKILKKKKYINIKMNEWGFKV